TYDYSIEQTLHQFTGHVQIQHEGYADSPTIREAIKLDEETISKIKSIDTYVASAPRIIGNGLIGNGKKSIGIAVMGLDPELESKASTLHKKLQDGKWLSNKNPNDIVVGYKMLNNLKAEIGDTVVLLVSAYDGAMGNMKFRISGTMKMGRDDFDKQSCVMNFSAANELFALYGKYHTYAILLDNKTVAQAAKDQIQTLLAKEKNLAVLRWDEVVPELMQSIQADRVSGMVMLFILSAIVIFGVYNTITMSISERYNEFGVMLAVGCKKSILFWTVFFETLFIAMIGIISGVIPSYIICVYFNINPIELTGAMAEQVIAGGFEPFMPTSTDVMIFLRGSLLMLFSILVLYLIPGRKILKLEALKGIRHT
ncbi:MAG: hypothetical protein B7C24_18085, partial [Bacteroidetes bacterium 4572_77]